MASTEGVREEGMLKGRHIDTTIRGEGPTPGNNPVQQAFGSGATRSTSEGKVDYEGHIDPEVLAIYGDYMNRHRYQRDGTLRGSDNWQSWIPIPAYMKSLVRHSFELWRMYRGNTVGNPDAGGKPFTFEEVTSAILFNVMGLMREMHRGSVLLKTFVSTDARKDLEGQMEKAKQEAVFQRERERTLHDLSRAERDRAMQTPTKSEAACIRETLPGQHIREAGIEQERSYTMTITRNR